MVKDNLLFKLDNLEYQYHYLNGSLDQFHSRLTSTTKIYNAKSKKISKKISKLLSEASLPEVKENLNTLRTEVFNKKVYYLEKHLRAFLLKQISQYRPTKKSKTDFKTVIQSLEEKYGLEKFVELTTKSKIIKLSLSKLAPSKNVSPPDWFLDHPFWKIHQDKTQEFNPSRVWNEILQKTEKSDQLVSTLMNNEKCKELISGFNSGMDVFLAINRDKKAKNKESESKHNQEDRRSSNDESESDSITDGNADDGEEVDEESLKQYDGLLVASDDEGEAESEDFRLDPNIDYNEVTDEESGEGDDETGHDKQEKAQLPELMGGYYSGGDTDDESDPADDKIAREQISLKEKKKNRRGQRARRKIWEKKYGRQAKHIQTEVQKDIEDRKRRQEEYEERVVKRAAKEVEQQKSGRVTSRQETPVLQPDHPSWVAKKNAEEKQKNAKYEGKKIKFD